MSVLLHNHDQTMSPNPGHVTSIGVKSVSEVLPRIAKRALVLVWHLSWALIGFAIRIAVNRVLRSKRTRAEIIGQTMLAVLQRLGPTYLKLGQILSTRPDLFSDTVLRYLASLQEQVPPESFQSVPERFKEDFGIDIDQTFVEFERRPVASASVATVYRAKLRDGRLVAVKIRRTGIIEQIETDLYLLRFVASALQHIPALRLIPLRKSVDEFGVCLVRQTDFQLEAAANRRIRAALAADPNVVIPELVEDLCSASILTMDFISDVRHPQVLKPEAAQAAMLTALLALYRMIFSEGFVHCDMHLGNLHLLDDGRIVLLDFGFMAELQAQERIKFAEFFYAMSINDGLGCAASIIETASFCPPDIPMEKFQAEVSTLVTAFSRATTGNYQVSDFVVRLFDLQRRYRVRGTSDFTMAIVSLLILEGLTKRFHPTLDFQSKAGPFIVSAFLLRYQLRGDSVNRGTPSLGADRARQYAQLQD